MFAGDARFPVQSLVCDLLNFFDIFHELREIFELSPLVVHAAQGSIYFD
jgi:hypothetical protein